MAVPRGVQLTMRNAALERQDADRAPIDFVPDAAGAASAAQAAAIAASATDATTKANAAQAAAIAAAATDATTKANAAQAAAIAASQPLDADLTALAAAPVAVASLPAAGNAGRRRTVTDSNATLTAGIGAVVAAGGANVVPVFDDGTNWRIG